MVLSIIACLIAFFSIFAFFGEVIWIDGASNIPNMFDLMLGIKESESFTWSRYSTLTFLFVLQLVICIIAIIGIIIECKIYNFKMDDDNDMLYKIPLALLSFVASIISFSATDIGGVALSENISIGFGPLFYGILQILLFIFLLIQILIFFKNKIGIPTPAKKVAAPIKNYSSTVPPTKTNTPVMQKPVNTKSILTEDQRIEYLSKYKKMFDDGVITEEEFNKKKSELL